MEEIENKVANSALVTFDLEDYFPKEPLTSLDVKDFLFEGIILKEKDFRAKLNSTDWSTYKNHWVYVHCSEDTIIPTWAYMLVGSKLQDIALGYALGTKEQLLDFIFTLKLSRTEWESFKDKKVVLKGCSKFPVPTSAYSLATMKLLPVVSSLMFGEPCSTVPVFKKK